MFAKLPDIPRVWSMDLYITILICVAICVYILLVVIVLCCRSYLVVSIQSSVYIMETGGPVSPAFLTIHIAGKCIDFSIIFRSVIPYLRRCKYHREWR